jgi:cytochrome oxidase assembly protein ShyY1
MVSPQTKTFIAGSGLFASAVVCFNGFVWQMQRRTWKDGMISNFANLNKDALTKLPKPGESVAEFTPIEVQGTLDNEGSIVVGPRPMPAKREGSQNEETRAGFVVLTPFEEDGTGYVIMVNRGWVPIDAAKTRLQRVQYTGDGFKHVSLRGIVRKEESMNSWIWGENTDANTGPSIGVAWLASRPYEVTRNYFERRYGANQVEERTAQHGARHWMLEVLEDHSGEDQRYVKGKVFPIRRREADITFTNITPTVHGFYAGFWLTTCLMSLFMMRKIRVDQRQSVLTRKARDEILGRDTSRMREEQAIFNDQIRQISLRGGSASDIKLDKAVPEAAIAAAAAKMQQQQQQQQQSQEAPKGAWPK